MTRPPLPRRALGAVLAILAIALAWQLGQRRGLALGEARTRAVSAATPDGDERRDDLATLAGEREMLGETVRALRAELGAADRLSAAERAELALYRRIGADGAPDGLAIDEIGRRGDDAATVRLTLVQARGRDRIDGIVEVVGLGADAAALPPDESGRARAALDDGPEATWSAPFDLRFFETLEIPLGEAVPPVLEVRVVPSGGKHASFRRRFRRDEIRILD